MVSSSSTFALPILRADSRPPASVVRTLALRKRFRLGGAVVAISLAAPLAPAGIPLDWRAKLSRVEIPCSDGAIQPAMWFAPPDHGPKPLLVGLHTWSSRYDTEGQIQQFLAWCEHQGWAFVHPDFRGPNNTPEAMGSDRAVQDVVEAVEWAKTKTEVDDSRIYLIGASGGGHMTLQMAGRHPEIWAGASAWCGITDIAVWYEELRASGKPYHYMEFIEGALGAAPTEGKPAHAAAWRRSPLSSLHRSRALPLDINHGIFDFAVPFTHALRAFNAVVPVEDRLDEAGINAYLAKRTLPEGWSPALPDASYGGKQPLFRKTTANARVTIFDGGHEIIPLAALNWLAMQRKDRPAVWVADGFVELDLGGHEVAK